MKKAKRSDTARKRRHEAKQARLAARRVEKQQDKTDARVIVKLMNRRGYSFSVQEIYAENRRQRRIDDHEAEHGGGIEPAPGASGGDSPSASPPTGSPQG